MLEEIKEVLGGRDYVDAEDLDKLQYMNQVWTVCFVFPKLPLRGPFDMVFNISSSFPKFLIGTVDI